MLWMYESNFRSYSEAFSAESSRSGDFLEVVCQWMKLRDTGFLSAEKIFASESAWLRLILRESNLLFTGEK